MWEKFVVAALLAGSPSDAPPPIQEDRLAVICFNTGEQTSGSYKICYYKCLNGTVAITVPQLSFCPLNIDR